MVDAKGLPIVLKLTPSQAHDGRSAADMLDGLGPGQPLLAARAYDSNALRAAMLEQGAFANIKPLSRRKEVPVFSPYLYRERNRVERFFNRVQHFRGLATRYDRTPDNYLAALAVVSAFGSPLCESAA